jgi:AcrR family transcriptional regulator
MARRKDHSRAELGALVLEAATALATAEGLRGVAMRRIAEAIGYAPGSIYNAVGDLDDVVLRVNGATLTGLAAALEAALAARPEHAPASAPEARALVLAEAYLDYVSARRLLWGMLFEHTLPAGRTAPDWFREMRDAPVQVVMGALGPLFPGDAAERRRAVLTLWAALQGVVAMALSGALAALGDEAEPRRLVRLLVARYVGSGGRSGQAGEGQAGEGQAGEGQAGEGQGR